MHTEKTDNKKYKVCLLCLERYNKNVTIDICPSCNNYLHPRSFESSYRSKYTIRGAYLNLFLAIKKQAYDDEAVYAWEKYWIENPEMSIIWKLLRGG